MAATLAFYRRLGLDIPAGADAEPHVEVALPGGLRLAWDTHEMIRSFDPGFAPPTAAAQISLAFQCADPAEVDATYADLVGGRARRAQGAVGRVLGAAVRRRARPGRQQRGPVRALRYRAAVPASSSAAARRPAPSRPGPGAPGRRSPLSAATVGERACRAGPAPRARCSRRIRASVFGPYPKAVRQRRCRWRALSPHAAAIAPTG